MADETEVLRDFRADIAEPDADRLDRIADTIAARRGVETSARSSTPANASDIPVLSLDVDQPEPEVRIGERGRRAVAGVVAAAAVLVVGAIALSLVNDDQSPVASGGEALPPLIADHPPEGLHLVDAHRYTTTVEPPASSYVPAGQTDPFAGPVILISNSGPESDEDIPVDPDDAFVEEVVEVDGRTVALDRRGDMISARWLGAGTFHFLLARGITDDELRTAIGGARLSDDHRSVVAADALPDGWLEFDPAPSAGVRDADLSGFIIYATPGDSDPDGSREVYVNWGPGNPFHLEWQRLRVDEDAIGCSPAGTSESCPDVAGSPVVIGAAHSPTNDPPIVMAWLQDGRMVYVVSTGISVGELYVFAESLRPTTWEALEQAIDPT